MLKTFLKTEENIILSLILFLAIFWFIWLYGNGIALSPDSTAYLYYSIYIKSEFDFSHIPTVWPPAYPAFIALGQFIMNTPTQSAVLVSTVMLFLTFYFLNKIMLIANLSLIIRAFAILFLFFNPKFLYVFHYAWSEGIFTAAFLGAVYFLARHFKEEKIQFLIYATVLVSVAALSRYLGYSMIILILIYIISYQFCKRELFSKSSLINYVIVLASGFLSFLWIIRNYLIDETFHGHRNPSPYTVADNLYYLIKIVTVVDNKIITLVSLLFLPIFLFSFFKYLKNNFNYKNPETFVIVIFSMAVFIYISLTIYSASTAAFDRLSTRFFAPIYPFISFIFFVLIKIVIKEFFSENVKKLIAFNFLWVLFIVIVFKPVNYFNNKPVNYFNISYDVKHPTSIGYNKSKLKTEVESWLLVNLMEKETINLMILADDREQENPRLTWSRALLLRELEGVSVYNYSVDGRGLRLSVVIDDSKYFINFIPASSVDDEFLSNLYNVNTLALIDERRYKQFKEKYGSINCKVKKIHTLYGLGCVN